MLQELEKVIEFAPKIDAQDLKISESEAKAQVAKQKCEEFEVRITKIDNEWTAYQKDERKLQDVITKFDDGIKRVEGVLFIFGLHSFAFGSKYYLFLFLGTYSRFERGRRCRSIR